MKLYIKNMVMTSSTNASFILPLSRQQSSVQPIMITLAMIEKLWSIICNHNKSPNLTQQTAKMNLRNMNHKGGNIIIGPFSSLNSLKKAPKRFLLRSSKGLVEFQPLQRTIIIIAGNKNRTPKKKKLVNVWMLSPQVLKLIAESPIRQQIEIWEYD